MPDILFNCRACHQQLVVDVSGAGLTIPCPGCAKPVKVPSKGDTGLIRFPEAETLKSRAGELEAALATEQKRAGQTEACLKSLTNRLEAVEKESEHAAAESQRRVRELESSHASVREEKDVAHQRIRQLEDERARFEESATRTAGELQTFRQEAGRNESAAKDLTAKIAGLEASLDKSRLHLTEANAETEYFRDHFDQLRIEHEKMAAELERFIENRQELERRLRASETERQELAVAAKAQTNDGSLLQRNRDLAAHRDRLSVELREARAALLLIETQLYHALSAREGLTAMVTNLGANLDGTTELNHAMLGTVDALEHEVRRLEGKLRSRPDGVLTN